MTTAVQIPNVVVRPIGDQSFKFRRVEHGFTHICTILGFHRLVLTIHDLTQTLHQDAFFVTRKQRIPLRAPNDFDDIPTRTTEFGFELLNDAAIAAHRAIQTLQVAVDDKHKVAQAFTTRHTNRTQ